MSVRRSMPFDVTLYKFILVTVVVYDERINDHDNVGHGNKRGLLGLVARLFVSIAVKC